MGYALQWRMLSMIGVVKILIEIALIVGSLYIARYVNDKMVANSNNNNGKMPFDIKDKKTRQIIMAVYALSCIGIISSSVGSYRYLVARLIYSAIGIAIAFVGLKVSMNILYFEPTEETEFIVPVMGAIAVASILFGVLGIFI